MTHLRMLYVPHTLLLLFCLCVTGHRITELSVPLIADPRSNVTLVCRYDMEGDYLYSVKWFKDNYEFLRFMPRQEQSCSVFSVPGVHLEYQRNCCNLTECSATLIAPRSYSTGLYKCEVSSEAPKFKTVMRRGQMHVAGLPENDPAIDGVNETIKPGDLLELTCTSDYSLPAAKITWFVNEEKAPLDYLELPTSTVPDQNGLVSCSQLIRFPVNESHFETPNGKLSVICEAALPYWLPGPTITRNTTIEITNAEISGAFKNNGIAHLNLGLLLLVVACYRRL